MPRMSENMLLSKREQPVLYIRRETNLEGLFEVIGGGFMKIGSYLEEIGEQPLDTPFLLYENFDSFTDERIVAEVVFAVSRLLPEKGEIKSRILPAMQVVSAYYRGDYNEMAPFYQEMMQWAKDKGLALTGDSHEYYLNGPDYPMEEMLTKVEMPVAGSPS